MIVIMAGLPGTGKSTVARSLAQRLPAAVHPVPSDIDAEAAQMVLAALGTRTDSLTPAQRSYLASWRIGS